MKKITILLFLLAGGTAVVYYFSPKTPRSRLITPQSSSLATASPDSILNSLDELEFSGRSYHYAFAKIDNLDNLHLYPNFSTKASSKDLIKKFSCRVLINGGFYDQENEPLGWLISENQAISQKLTSDFFNGFFGLTSNNQVVIGSLLPSSVKLGLQSGPLLILDSKPLVLKIKDDETQRRLLVAKSNSNELVFIIITGPDSAFTGPLLADVPQILVSLGKKLNLTFSAALNLDGGSASVFYTQQTYLPEFSPIGSFFCLN